MFKRFMICVAMLLAVISVAVRAAPMEDPPKEEAVKMVDRAVAFSKTNTREKTLAQINQKDGPFHQGELYVFVYDLHGEIVAHPVNQKLVGKNMLEVPDPDGKFYRKEIVETAISKGSGWVDYKYKHPQSGHIEAKTTFFKKNGDLIFACGVYK